MGMRPNYRQQRSDRTRAKEAKKQEKLAKREADAQRRRAEREGGAPGGVEPGDAAPGGADRGIAPDGRGLPVDLDPGPEAPRAGESDETDKGA